MTCSFFVLPWSCRLSWGDGSASCDYRATSISEPWRRKSRKPTGGCAESGSGTRLFGADTSTGIEGDELHRRNRDAGPATDCEPAGAAEDEDSTAEGAAPMSRTVQDAESLNIPVIEVRAWGKLVEAIAADPTLGYYAFADHPSWRRLGIELAPLTMPLSDSREIFNFPASCSDFMLRRCPACLQMRFPTILEMR